ncbi:MAG: Fur family transcriptional regulator [Solirubrobacteraceae bacterium]|jgi:Fe2+ or Zn2+ uptake regulation protein
MPVNADPHAPPATAPGDFAALLHARGQRATPQRLVILRELRRTGRHCTADELRGAIGHELPGTSTPTVYATLDLLVELGLARRIDAGTGATLYDPRTEPHAHVACRACGRVEDLECAVDSAALLRAGRDAGFRGDAVDVTIHGLCAACAAAHR